MIPLGHVGGLPVEEFLPALATTGASIIATRAWRTLRPRRLRRREAGR